MKIESMPEPGQHVDGTGLALIVNAISPSLLPHQDLDDDQEFPTTMLRDLFGEDDQWLVHGGTVGGALLRELRLVGSMNTERAVRETVAWFAAHHPGSSDVRIETLDYRGADVVLRIDYPPDFLKGVLERISLATRGKSVTASGVDAYRFSVRF